MFYSSKNKEYITLKEYIQNMSKDQNEIYYVSGETLDKIDNLPQVDQVKDKGYEILYLTEPGDEFVINTLMEYDGKKFVNISSEKFDLDENKEKTKELNESNKEMLNVMKDAINVSEVRFTGKLKKHPVCLTSKGDISIEMEKVINAMPTDQKIKAELVLEINENHPIVNKLIEISKDKEELNKYAKILYTQARLIEGLPIENPTEISNIICDSLSK